MRFHLNTFDLEALLTMNVEFTMTIATIKIGCANRLSTLENLSILILFTLNDTHRSHF